MEILLEIAQLCNQPGSLRGVCKAWRAGLEGSYTKLSIIDSPLPSTLGSRFSSLTELDLLGSTIISTPALLSLQSGPGLPLTSLALRLDVRDLTEGTAQALRDLDLIKLNLELGDRSPAGAGRGIFVWKSIKTDMLDVACC